MTTNKRIADALEKIAAELKELNTTGRHFKNINEMLLTSNETAVQTNQKHYNLSLANIFNAMVEAFGENAIAFLNAIQTGDLEAAQSIAMAKNAPKKRGRKPKAAVTDIKPEPKKRGRKPKQPQN